MSSFTHNIVSIYHVQAINHCFWQFVSIFPSIFMASSYTQIILNIHIFSVHCRHRRVSGEPVPTLGHVPQHPRLLHLLLSPTVARPLLREG